MKKNNFLVTVIIPVYNAEKYLQFCLDSVISQTYNNLEIILVNDGSTDGTKTVCDTYAKKDSRVKVINKINGGVSSARNIGLKNASGEYIMFVDSDDSLVPGCVEKCLKIATSKKVDIVKFSYEKELGFVRKVYKYNTITNRVIKRADFNKKILSSLFSNYDFTNVWSMMIKSNIAKKVFFENYITGEDFLYSVKCINIANTVYVIDEPLYKYRINWSSNTHVCDVRSSIDELIVLSRISEIVKNADSLMDRTNSVIYADIVNCSITHSYSEYKKYLESLFGQILSNGFLGEIEQEEKYLSKSFYRKLRLCNFYKIVAKWGNK